ncbi:class I SAM-dependent methyltransferase [Desertibaculum subflavum]|uniref:class I SAM-dependent methyltransferase n=1 Tax=Desertibaculum subflavum TaxID=2268458 RepID=UPI0034D2C152
MTGTGGEEAVAPAGAREIWSLTGVSRWTRMGLIAASAAGRGSLTVRLPDGRRVRVAGAQTGPDAELHLKNERLARRLLTGGNIGVAESYLDGDFDSPDLVALVEWAAANQALDDPLLGKPWRRLARRALFALQANTRKGSRRNIASHYDLGNEFYARWLDPSMTYSSAVFAAADEPLEQAQANKYRRIAALAEVRPDHEVLEIGAGWGGFACFAAREIGCKVTGITISRAQHDYAAKRVQEEGLAERVKIELRDYRDLDHRFDRVASIEMLEAVGERYWPVFFDKLRDCLKPGGRAALQVITIDDRYFDDYRRSMDFIQKYIFPGGMLPSPAALRRHVEAAGMAWLVDHGFRNDYAETLSRWRTRFLAAWPGIRELGFDERFRRMWDFYLAYCAGGFRAGTIDVKQIAVAR